MNVIWHDYEGMQLTVPENLGVVVDGFHNHVRDGAAPPIVRIRITSMPRNPAPVPQSPPVAFLPADTNQISGKSIGWVISCLSQRLLSEVTCI